ncbi:MAG: hypothetical protein H7Y60_06540 [Rhodospirillaceae bacterium]|nr:hypothetical protein [Rhodospirillales bacterium]
MNTQSHTPVPVPSPFGDLLSTGMDEFVPARAPYKEATSAEADVSYRIGQEAADMQANRDSGWRAHMATAPDGFYAEVGHGVRMHEWIAKRDDAVANGDWDLFIKLNGMAA